MMRAVLVSLALVSCASPTGRLRDGRFMDADVSYTVAPPDDGWRELRLPTADAAWHNEALATVLLVSSHCEGVADSPLEGLTSDLLMGMTDREIVSQERVPSSQREAMVSVATGKLDGVARKLALFVLKKDGCVYDIVLDANPQHFDGARAVFDRVVASFDVDARPNRR
jgi:hypothetical protein